MYSPTHPYHGNAVSRFEITRRWMEQFLHQMVITTVPFILHYFLDVSPYEVMLLLVVRYSFPFSVRDFHKCQRLRILL